MGNLIEVFPGLVLDVADELSPVLRCERIALDEPLGQPDDTQLEATAELNRGTCSSRDLDAAAADVHDDGDIAGCPYAIDGRRVDMPGFFRPGNHVWTNARLIRDGLEELAAVLGFPRGTCRDGNDFVHRMRFGQTPEFRENLKRSMHRLRRQRLAVKTARAQPDHLFLAIDDLERQVGPDLHDDHVDGVGADVDGRNPHGFSPFNIMSMGQIGLSIMFIVRSELLGNQVDRFTSALNGAVKGDVRALHRARVASRRLRELLAVLQLDRETTRKLGRRLRKVTRRLGGVRELDVLLLLIDELHVSRPEHSQALSRITVPVSKARDDARERLFDRMPVEDMKRIARKLRRLADNLAKAEQANGATSDAWRWAADARTAFRASRVSEAVADAGAVYLPDRLHGVRITVKKLRYSVELANEVAGRRATSELRVLKRAQDTLGRLHDVQVLIDRVRQVQASLAPPTEGVWRSIDRLLIALEDDCRRLHARYLRQRTRLEALAARLSAHPGTAHQGLPVRHPRGKSARASVHTTADRPARRPVAV